MSTNTFSESYFSYINYPGLCSTYNNFFSYYTLRSDFNYLTTLTSWWTSNDYFYREVGNSFGGIYRSNSQASIPGVGSTSVNHDYRSIRCLKD